MEPNEFIDSLLTEVSLEAIEYASDVERILAEEVLFLREQLAIARQEAVVGAHALIKELYDRLEDKDAQIDALREEVRFLRGQIAP
ncbi:hypothetical protein DRJ12_01820 [Candidatus Acetothermia bacterium]|nr:MAG: hypothetical protein DRJ12_01820 [Candidatus Acetothermia bacterium]